MDVRIVVLMSGVVYHDGLTDNFFSDFVNHD